MNVLELIFLGILQGLTEFLPISSSGHLVIAQSLLPHLPKTGALLEITLHAGTMLAIIVFFWRDILRLDRRMIALLAVGNIPAGLIGVFFYQFLMGFFNNIKLVGFALLLTGIVNWLVDGENNTRSTQKISIFDSLVIGVFQAIAIIPGISRSGTTIFAGLLRGLDRRQVAVFSFLLSIPAVAGAVMLQTLENNNWTTFSFLPYTAGFLAAFVSGYLAIGVIMDLLLRYRFRFFAVYCLALGLTTLFLAA